MNEEQLSRPSDMADEQNNGQNTADGITDDSGAAQTGDTGDVSSTDDMSSAASVGLDTDTSSAGNGSGGATADGGQTEAQSDTQEAVSGLENQAELIGDMPGDTTSQLRAMDVMDAAAATPSDADAPAQAMGEGEPAVDNAGAEPAGMGEQAQQGQQDQQPRPDQPPGGQSGGGQDGGDQGRPPRFQRPYQDEGSDEAPPELVVRPARDPNMENVAANASMEDLMKASAQQYRTLKHGDVLEGTVMKVDREEILLDIGAKTEGVIPSREATSMSEEERSALKIGDEVLVSVLQPENSEGHAVLSVDRARQERAWRDLHKQYEAGEIIQAQVVGHNKGGLLVNLEGIRGFVPSSQISSMPPGEANKQAELARLHNSTMPLKIIEINRNRNRLILSERQAMQEQRESMRSRLLQELEPGQIRPGTVTSICDFGAFVDIGGADGLIHLSELSWKRVSHPSELLKPGDRINVYVLSVDPNERKIALSLKRTQPEPWDTITDQYQLGQVVHGTITQITSFGAFARLEDGIEGLIHVSELAEGRVAHPRSVVNEGDSMDLKVIRIDPARKRIGLSLKRMNENVGSEEGGEDGQTEGTMGAGGEQSFDQPQERTGDGGAPRQEPREPRETREPREPREPRQPAQPRQERAPRPPVSSTTFDVPDEEDAPSGALAAALAAHAQRGRTQQETAEDEAPEEDTAPTTSTSAAPSAAAGMLDTDDLPEIGGGDFATDNLTDTGAGDTGDTGSTGSDEEGAVDSGPAMGEAALADVLEPADTTDTVDTTDTTATDIAPSGSASEDDASSGDGSPEAMMPSAAATDEAATETSMEDAGNGSSGTDSAVGTSDDAAGSGDTGGDTADAGPTSMLDAQGEGSDSGAASGSEGAPSMGDAGGQAVDTSGTENSDAGNFAQPQSDVSSVAGSDEVEGENQEG